MCRQAPRGRVTITACTRTHLDGVASCTPGLRACGHVTVLSTAGSGICGSKPLEHRKGTVQSGIKAGALVLGRLTGPPYREWSGQDWTFLWVSQ